MITEVSPVIVRPYCLKVERKQDCFNCELRIFSCLRLCDSPRGLCVREYPNHKKGCPNYGKKKGCPPSAPMFDDIYNLSRPIYAIYNRFDFKGHVDRMREKHPDWSQRQLECCLYWQGTARKELKMSIKIFQEGMLELNRIFSTGKEYSITTVPEAMGVNVTKTMKKVGIELEWPPVNVAYQIAFAAILKERG